MTVLGGLGLGYDANLYRLYIQTCPWWRQSETTKMRGRVNHRSGPKVGGEGCHASASKPKTGKDAITICRRRLRVSNQSMNTTHGLVS